MLLKDAITIPPEVQPGDLVFRLADAEADSTATLEKYVVTDQLLGAFHDAVALLRSATDESVSKAALLTGSFGAGKSNFMGVLQLLLDGHPGALAKPELAPVVRELRDWQGDRRFLTIPFYLIGARTLESAIFGGYVRHLRKIRPDAPLPDVFADEPLLKNADQLRTTLGDHAFFGALAGGDDEGWGDLAGWSAARYEAARSAPVGSSERSLLVQALLASLLSSFASAAEATAGGYVDMDLGLAAISRHAQELGYAGIILFLDELILWLLSRMADTAFATEEASKLATLVEGATADRPVPIVSLIARQRDLRDLVGTERPGIEKMAFVDQLDYQTGRFGNIVLDDSNLPMVAHHRLLKPSSKEGSEALEQAFADLHLGREVRDALCGDLGGEAAFRLTYPFSPAFLKVVVDVAEALQRTRTGLRLLLQLLVDRRDELTVGELVPVGDLYDVLAASEDPFSEEMKAAFSQAKRLYANRLRPLLMSVHQLRDGDSPTPAFRTDDRLVKTLLLAALVPTSAPFKDLTASRLVALNHGLISSPVPGQEIGVVVTKLRAWASQMGELQVGTDAHNPTVGVILSDIDTRAILEAVRAYDNPGTRRQLIREFIIEELGLPSGQLGYTYQREWRGVRREVDVRFGNVRDRQDLADSDFASSGDRWKVVIDFPFDDEGHSSAEDLRRIDELRGSGLSWRTVAWLPAFFTAPTLEMLGTLVRLDHVLATAERFSDATKNLSPATRAAVRPRLEAQRFAARRRLGHAVRMAYGVVGADPSVVDTTHGQADHFPSLCAGLEVRPPVAADLREALDQMIDQALAFSFPAAPALEREASTAVLRRVLEVCQEALEHPDGRLPVVPSADRNLMRAIANPLRLGTQSEQAFVVERVAGHWDNHFTRKLTERERAGSGGPATVAELRRWIDEPVAMGLTRALQDLVLTSWASATNRRFLDHGGPARVGIDQLADHLEVVAQPLPTGVVWEAACDRAERIFGVPGLPDAPSATGLAKLSGALVDAVDRHRSSVADLGAELILLADAIGHHGGARLRTARSAAELFAQLDAQRDDLGRAEALASAPVDPSPEAVGRSISAAGAVNQAIRTVDVDVLQTALGRPEGAELARRLGAVLDADELALSLAPELQDIYGAARMIILGPVPSSSSPPLRPPPPGRRVVRLDALDIDAAESHLAELRERLASGTLSDLRVDIAYTEPDLGDAV